MSFTWGKSHWTLSGKELVISIKVGEGQALTAGLYTYSFSAGKLTGTAGKTHCIGALMASNLPDNMMVMGAMSVISLQFP